MMGGVKIDEMSPEYLRGLEDAAKMAERAGGSTPPRYRTGIARGLSTEMQAENCLNAGRVKALEIACAIRALALKDHQP